MRKLFLILGLFVGLATLNLAPLATAAETAVAAQPAVKMPAIFSDNMVLQRGIPVPVWGWAAPGEQITLSFAGQKKTATAGADGKWTIKLDKLAAGGPQDMTITGKEGTVTIRNVAVGEVWICSGQSNMEWPLRAVDNAQQVIAQSKNPNLRHFTLNKAQADQPQADCRGKWDEADPAVSGNFTAVGYFFGRKLQQDLGVPVGLIHTSWGGTPIEVWMSKAVQESDPQLNSSLENYRRRWNEYVDAIGQYHGRLSQLRSDYQKMVIAARDAGRPAPLPPPLPDLPGQPGWRPAVLYNAMIAPIVGYGVAGAIWYQGESNAGNARLYRRQMPALIKNWRDDWGQGHFTFIQVSLANFMARKDQPTDSAWAELREAQALTAQTFPKTGVAMAIDIGDANDIHPRNKKDVGERLALNALAIEYGKDVVYSGPVYESMKLEDGRIRISFKHLGGGLVVKGGELKGFAIAGEDRNFVWADAKIEGDTVVVSSPGVARPVAVRYAWADNPECNLYNKAGLPAVPFRTDDWPRK